ncbi:MAG: hypothetical protein Q7K25_01735 [Actinomycetota bacterium]|nr:hypothetical protein [Actinomycetota bacterium]
MSALAIAVLLASQVGTASALTDRIDERFTTYGIGIGIGLGDAAKFGHWRVVFDGVTNGHGVRISKSGLLLTPQAVAEATATSSTLVVSRRKFSSAPLHLSATWTSQRSTRIGPPNPWETGWLIWDYVDAAHFTYLILKPNGWEVGRRDPSQPGGQRFIVDGSTPATPLGMPRTATVDRVNDQTTIRVDGVDLASFTLPSNENRGSIGMYSEDAVVLWNRILVATS